MGGQGAGWGRGREGRFEPFVPQRRVGQLRYRVQVTLDVLEAERLRWRRSFLPDREHRVVAATTVIVHQGRLPSVIGNIVRIHRPLGLEPLLEMVPPQIAQVRSNRCHSHPGKFTTQNNPTSPPGPPKKKTTHKKPQKVSPSTENTRFVDASSANYRTVLRGQFRHGAEQPPERRAGSGRGQRTPNRPVVGLAYSFFFPD